MFTDQVCYCQARQRGQGKSTQVYFRQNAKQIQQHKINFKT